VHTSTLVTPRLTKDGPLRPADLKLNVLRASYPPRTLPFHQRNDRAMIWSESGYISSSEEMPSVDKGGCGLGKRTQSRRDRVRRGHDDKHCHVHTADCLVLERYGRPLEEYSSSLIVDRGKHKSYDSSPMRRNDQGRVFRLSQPNKG
jgi:hypothetical protein